MRHLVAFLIHKMISELHQFGILTLIRCSVLLLYHNCVQCTHAFILSMFVTTKR